MTSPFEPSARPGPADPSTPPGRNGHAPTGGQDDEPPANGVHPPEVDAPDVEVADDDLAEAQPAGPPRCRALTASGRPCRNPPQGSHPYCALHARILRERVAARSGRPAVDPELDHAGHPVQRPGTAVEVVRSPTLVVQPAAPWSARAIAVAVAVVAGLALLGALVGYIVAGRGQEIRASRAEITYLLDDSLPTGFLREDRRLSTQIVTLESRSLLEPIATAHDLDVDDLVDDVDASVLDDSEVIRVEVRDTDGERAVAILDELLVAYTERLRTESASPETELVSSELAAVDDELVDVLVRLRQLDQTPDDADEFGRQMVLIERRDDIAERLDDTDVGETEGRTLEIEQRVIERDLIEMLSTIVVDLGDEPDAATVAERDALAARVTDLLADRAELLARDGGTVDAEPVSVLTPPYLIDEPVAPKPMRSALAGGLVGLVVGLLALVAHRRLPTGRG